MSIEESKKYLKGTVREILPHLDDKQKNLLETKFQSAEDTLIKCVAKKRRLPKRPNKRIEKWLSEWHREATRKGGHQRFTYGAAIRSLKKFPLPLTSGNDCKILSGFGDKICSMIDERFNEENDEDDDDDDENEFQSQTKRKKREHNNKQLSQIDQEAMNRIRELENKFLRNNNHHDDNSPSISTTTLLSVNTPGTSTTLSSTTPTTTTLNRKNCGRINFHQMTTMETEFMMNNNSNEIKQINGKLTNLRLCIDVCEGSSPNSDVATHLNKLNVRFEQRRLPIGDFIWIGEDVNGDEYILPYTIERKRIDDLCKSVLDGRYSEQKMRLFISQIKFVMYLIEHETSNYSDNYSLYNGLALDINDSKKSRVVSLPDQTIQQLLINTQIVHRFFIKQTTNRYQTAVYLKQFTEELCRIFTSTTLPNKVLHFQDWKNVTDKRRSPTIRVATARFLLVIPGIGLKVALAITNHFQTISNLQQQINSNPNIRSIFENISSKDSSTRTKRAIPKNVIDGLIILFQT
ncbi:hypothetical protein SNEBB_010802 [Seison nebaliae]|nr:hypothetical protein SNEBB_010802 [Seison nebaliae]